MTVETFVTPARVHLTEATRRLIDAVLTAEDTGEEALDSAAHGIDAIAAQLGPSGARSRVERAHFDYLPRSPLVGEVSPIAPPFAWESRDGRVYGRGKFSAACEGPPGYVHGGWIALAFDEILGMANLEAGQPGMTGKLTIRYRRPTPLHADARFEGWTERIDGRRITTRGTCTVDGELTAEAEGLFVIIDAEKAAEYFGV